MYGIQDKGAWRQGDWNLETSHASIQLCSINKQ